MLCTSSTLLLLPSFTHAFDCFTLVFVVLPQTDFTLLSRLGFLFKCFFHWRRGFGEQAIPPCCHKRHAENESVNHVFFSLNLASTLSSTNDLATSKTTTIKASGIINQKRGTKINFMCSSPSAFPLPTTLLTAMLAQLPKIPSSPVQSPHPSALPMCAVVALALSIDTYTLAICLSEDLLPFRNLDKCSCVLLLQLFLCPPHC